MSHLLDEIIHAQKQGEARGIPSICSAHPWVLKTALCEGALVLIEATCNQVNQFGGYTGMTPADFASFVGGIAAENNFPPEHLLLGGDHLGPSPWQAEPMDRAMTWAVEMVQAYVRAGYTKIHLDASMKLGGDDPAHPLAPELAAKRTALLAKAAESVADPVAALRYIIGTEVPIPGGATSREQSVHVTAVEDARRTLSFTQAAFRQVGLESAWERVIALVVQPGVEFGDDFVLAYNPEAARDLAGFISTTPLVYEVHSTDYQSCDSLKDLVRDQFAILKVGPALTFAYREAVFALANIESELFPPGERSNLMDVLEDVMLDKPGHWQKYYSGTSQEQAFKRKYSLSDRIRYYWTEPAVQAALKKLMRNLHGKTLPLPLIEQFLPEMHTEQRSPQHSYSAARLIWERIQNRLDDYRIACGNTVSSGEEDL